MHLMTLSVRAIKKGKIIWEELHRKNVLHPQGKELLLSAAFFRENGPLGPLPTQWFIGLDTRSTIGRGDTLKEVVEYEPKSKDYARISIMENEGFSWLWQESEESGNPPEFTINASAEFTPNEDWGMVNNFFLTSVQEGDKGILVCSNKLKKPRSMDEEVSFTIDCLLNLREDTIK